MTILGIPCREVRDANPLSIYGTGYTSLIRDAITDWNERQVKNIAIAAVAEAAFALLSIVNTVETIASAIAALVVSGACFFIPPGWKEQFAENVRDPVKKYAVCSLVVTTATYLSLVENCKMEDLDQKAFIKALDFYTKQPEEDALDVIFGNPDNANITNLYREPVHLPHCKKRHKCGLE